MSSFLASRQHDVCENHMHYNIPGLIGHVRVTKTQQKQKVTVELDTHYTIMIMIRYLIKRLKKKGSFNDNHPACGSQMLIYLKILFAREFQTWNNVPIQTK